MVFSVVNRAVYCYCYFLVSEYVAIFLFQIKFQYAYVCYIFFYVEGTKKFNKQKHEKRMEPDF